MAALYIGVVLVMPDGLAGLYEKKLKPWWMARRATLVQFKALTPPPRAKKPADVGIAANLQGSRP
jgi:urea transport system permease protein